MAAEGALAVMEKYLLAPHVFMCAPGQSVVILDLKKDRYIGLGAAEAQAVCPLVEGWPNCAQSDAHARYPDLPRDSGSPAESLIADLLGKSLLTTDRAWGKTARPARLEKPARSVPYGPMQPVRSRDLAAFARVIASTYVHMKTRSLAHVIESIERRKHSLDDASPVGIDEVIGLAACFVSLRPLLFTAREACLFDSVALASFLLRHRVRPTFVIGVQCTPFASHSWVQYQDVVLNDTPGSVLHYEPILVV